MAEGGGDYEFGFDEGHSKQVASYLKGRKGLYSKDTCFLLVTKNPTANHNTPFLVQFPPLSQSIVNAFPRMGPGSNNHMYYVPTKATLVRDLEYDPPTTLDMHHFYRDPKFQVIRLAAMDVSKYIHWRGDTFVQQKDFLFKPDPLLADLGNSLFSY